MTPATRRGPISRRSRSMRRFRVTTYRDRSPSSAGRRSRRSRATSGLRASARDGPNTPSSWPTGWAEYAEQLADEMGLYSSDTARLGALADITLSAALLVVDTGINAFGWTREQGIAYIRDHTRVPRLRAEVPVDRYPIWPAQGLSYALGRLEIWRLRAAATGAFGSRFDLRVFHDRVLADGAVPLPLLRENIERWIAAAR